ncbi:CACNA1F [Symbiodinium sp. CCMP2592]|nr:CACNA1F [Symbiodinium sp. CCMP2592]
MYAEVVKLLEDVSDYLVDFFVLCYAISVGVVIDYQSTYREEPVWAHSLELSFCIIFVCELVLRLALAQRRFITGKRRWWNLLDTLAVSLMVLRFLIATSELLGTLSTALRIVRMVRVFRILWVLRAALASSSQLRQFRILLESLTESMNVLGWLLILILSNVYIFSLIFTESSLWDEIAILPWHLAASFLVFVAVSLVLANTITSFICSLQTIVSKRERDLIIDKELEYNEKLVSELYKVFHEVDQNGNGVISWTEFQLALEDERMHTFLSTLELDMSDARKIFHILASEQTNAIEESDFLLGCLRMRGGASAVDMVRIQMEQDHWFLAANLRQEQDQISETESGWSPDHITDDRIDRISVTIEPLEEIEDVALHEFQWANLESWQRAVTLQELLTIRGDLQRLCKGWRSERTGQHLVPETTNLLLSSRVVWVASSRDTQTQRHRDTETHRDTQRHTETHRAYHYILPQTAPLEGTWLRLAWDAERLPPALGQELCQVSEDAALPRAIAVILKVEVVESEAQHDGSPCLDLLVKLKRGRFLAGHRAPALHLGRESGEWSAAPERVWYCSHWWGEPIFEFVSGCRRHAEVRHLVADARYWVCGYANRQHELDQEISVNVVETSFYTALREAKGLLLILDNQATPFSRIWCDFELCTAIMSRDMGLDIVTTIPPKHGREAETRLLTTDLVPGESAVAKSVREQHFPIDLLAPGMLFIVLTWRCTVQCCGFGRPQNPPRFDSLGMPGPSLLENVLPLLVVVGVGVVVVLVVRTGSGRRRGSGRSNNG